MVNELADVEKYLKKEHIFEYKYDHIIVSFTCVNLAKIFDTYDI